MRKLVDAPDRPLSGHQLVYSKAEGGLHLKAKDTPRRSKLYWKRLSEVVGELAAVYNDEANDAGGTGKLRVVSETDWLTTRWQRRI